LFPKFVGDDCETDFDGCSLDGFSEGTNCTDVTPAEQQARNVSYICTDCPSGYVLEGTKCNGNLTISQLCITRTVDLKK